MADNATSNSANFTYILKKLILNIYLVILFHKPLHFYFIFLILAHNLLIYFLQNT
nr:MAG TPA_asm: hypothetical protein [Caudoviricetes sp.]